MQNSLEMWKMQLEGCRISSIVRDIFKGQEYDNIVWKYVIRYVHPDVYNILFTLKDVAN